MTERLVSIGKRTTTPVVRPVPAANAPKVFVETYGCQMNVADSDLIGSVLADAGYAQAARADEADVIVVNTCAVREKAEERVIARASELGALKLDKAETYEGLSGAIGGDGVSGFVTIQRGCDKFCTFCVVPFTRGRERGASPREVLRQVRELAEAGYKEVVLLGQTVNSYVWDDVTFAQLLRAVARVDGIERIRFTSPYPVDFTDDVVAAIADEPKICKYVHLPVQSGSDAVLERMRRGYSVADYRAIVASLRAAMPDIA